MGEMIYCRRPLAAAPYYIEEVSLNVYSLEELSYYIANNVYLLNQEFMSGELCNWIGRELGDRVLMKELQDLLRENAYLHVFIGKLLSAAGYLTAQEIRNIIEIISTFENKSEAEVKKLRADRLMERKKYVEAIYEYEAMLDRETEIPMSVNLKGDIYHNLGTAYGRLFFFKEAADCYDKAYRFNHRVPSLEAMLLCCRLLKDDAMFREAAEKYHVPADKIAELNERLLSVTEDEDVEAFAEKMNALISDDDRREKELRRQLSVWKENYSRISEI